MKEQHSHLAWKTLGRTWLNDFKIFQIQEVERETKDGIRATFYEVDAPQWVTVIPVIKDPELGCCFLMVRQYRHGSDAITLEFPAGMVEAGESAEESGVRELLEETGYRPGSLINLGEVSPNPAFMKNGVTTLLAEDLKYIQEQDLDEYELIELETVPVDRVVSDMGAGEYNNGIMMISLLLYLRHKNRIAPLSDDEKSRENSKD